jgi:hypothetical protein
LPVPVPAPETNSPTLEPPDPEPEPPEPADTPPGWAAEAVVEVEPDDLGPALDTLEIHDDPAPRRSRLLAGCMGLGLVGLVLALASVAVVVVAAGAFGWSAGWFAPNEATEAAAVPATSVPPTAGMKPVTHDPEVVARFNRAALLPEADLVEVQRAARSTDKAIGRRCGEGPQVVTDVLVDATGQIVFAQVDAEKSRLGHADPACVEAALLHVKAPKGVSREGKATVSLRLR